MNKRLSVAALFLAVILRYSLFSGMGSGIFNFNPVLCVLIVIALREDEIFAGACGLGAGFIHDALFSKTAGFIMTVYFALAYFTSVFKNAISSSNTVRAFFFGLADTIAYRLILVISLSFMDWSIDAKSFFDAIISSEMIVNTAACLVLMALFKKLDREPELSFGEDEFYGQK